MSLQRMDIERRQVIMHSVGIGCSSNREVVESHAFAQIVQAYVDALRKRSSTLLDQIPLNLQDQSGVSRLVSLLRAGRRDAIEEVARTKPAFGNCLEYRGPLYQFAEGLVRLLARASSGS